MNKQATIAIITTAGITAAAAAQTEVLVDDFEGNGLYTSRTILDGSGNDIGTGGAFAGSQFDVFGIVNRDVNFDFADDSAGSFPTDTFGILGTGNETNVFGAEDVDNGDNPGGGGSATWTVDISGLTDLSLLIDFAAMGDFESTDNTHTFSASIDGGGSQTLFAFDSNDDGVLTYFLESGTEVTLNDPLVETISGTTINNNFATLSAAIAGAGSELTITYVAGANNGGGEVFAFDNLRVSAVPTPGAAAILGLAGVVGLRRRR